MFVKYFSVSLEVNYCYIATKIASSQFRLTRALKCNESNYSAAKWGLLFIAIPQRRSEIMNV